MISLKFHLRLSLKAVDTKEVVVVIEEEEEEEIAPELMLAHRSR